ncbi:DHA2 family efflux MFS transporter permease subunit [Aquihabitans sp. G128]|uniref:DHA2 family efflux MFS transporter permease subunit n=1 Tax=Aquihabitans sp. G128 TaxID=2849779 RepID=UPI001C212F37|nr:DHA2 family efflux MFS transporter permease subunit [Aquihabitans sp. G128]QXC61123.1 DHA2 family efflux MFS transporter permease subunit [Aquihabitans sp. G128]
MTATVPSPAAARSTEEERHARRTLALSGLAVLVTFLDTTVLFVAFPDISKTFSSAGPAELSWVLNAYTIAFAALLVPAGKIADRVGHKRVFLAGSALFTLASAACALAPTVEVLIGFRVLQAFGAAALIPSSLALVLRAFPADRLPFAVAIWGAMGAAAGAVGPTLGASLVEAANWRWVFLINVPAGLVTVGFGRRFLRESSDPETRIPALAGIVSIAGAASLVSLAVVKSDEWGWVDGRTFAAFLLGAALFAFFLVHQRRTAAPALDLSLFGIRNYAWANAATFAFGTAFTAMFFGSFLILTQVWGYSVLRAGLGISPGPLVVAVLAPRFGKLAGRIGQRPLLIAGGLAFAAGGVWRIAAMGAQAHYVQDYLPGTLLTGLGVALCLPQLASVTSQALPANRLGVGGAANQAIRQFGGTLGVGLTIAFISQPTSAAQALDNFDRVWLLLVLGGVATSLLSLPLVTRHGPATLPAEDLVLAPELP